MLSLSKEEFKSIAKNSNINDYKIMSKIELISSINISKQIKNNK